MNDVSPLLNIEEYKSENIPSDRQIYNTLILSYDNIKYFLAGVKFLKNNQKFLETNPLTNAEDKMKTLKSQELKKIDLENKIAKMTDNMKARQSGSPDMNLVRREFDTTFLKK